VRLTLNESRTMNKTEYYSRVFKDPEMKKAFIELKIEHALDRAIDALLEAKSDYRIYREME